jgi:chromate transporter
MHTPKASATRLLDVAAIFLKLGCISFGGPVAHLGYLRAETVERRRWLDDAHFGDLVALCQFLPGPASSQLVFALGMHRAGLIGALLASLCFTLPSAALMIGFAYRVSVADDLAGEGWLHGLKVAAVAVVAQAVWGMSKSLCVDRARLAISLGAAALLLVVPGSVVQIAVVVAGGSFGVLLYRKRTAARAAPVEPESQRHHLAAASALVLFVVLLITLPVVASVTDSRAFATFDSFYRAGALVFGGGHVVLPLLRAEVVPNGWVTDDSFLAGYAAAQAVPGPLFTFAAYLGAAMEAGAHRWLNGLWTLFAIFLPAWLLIGGALPFWHALRARPWAHAALAGANASVVGVLLAALYHPLITGGIRDVVDVIAALVAFSMVHIGKAPAWLVVVAMAAAGQWLM